MPDQYYIQRAAFEDSEDSKDVLIPEEEWTQARQALESDPEFSPFARDFTYKAGRIDFQAEQWKPDDTGVTQAARALAKQLNARVFGEDDEEYTL